MKRKLMTALVAITLSFTLLSCGSGESGKTNDSQKTTTTSNSDDTQKEQETQTDETEFNGVPTDDGYQITGCHSDADTIVVPDTINGYKVTEVGSYCFAGLKAKSITLPDTVEVIGNSAFDSCSELETIDLGTSLKTVGYLAFASCSSLKKIDFPEGMTTMENCPVGNCANLTEVYVPASVTDIQGIILDPASCPNAVVVTPSGSTAETNCKEYNIPVQSE